MSSPNEKLCVQKRLLNLIKTDGGIWIIFIPLEIFCSFCISYFLTSTYPYIPVDLSNQVLSSLIDVSIALFGFVGLILVFTLRNLLTTKGNLQREKLDTDLKISQLEFKSIALETATEIYVKTIGGLESTIEKCRKRLEEINDGITHNEKQIKKAPFLNFASLGVAFVCILMSVWTFGAVGDEGLHLFNFTLLISLFFLCLDFVFKVIETNFK